MGKTYMEKDELGEHKVIEQGNGVKVRILKTPSSKYKKKIKKRSEDFKKSLEKNKIIDDKEKLIKDKMRELAIKELEREGKI